jgi:NAD(P)-dependent dehydrogenase (short-subunit alcohol dehydrogenase family)
MSDRPDMDLLVTGGTSGLGLELARLFLEKGYTVIATGRKLIDLNGYGDRFVLYRIDFSDLKKVAETTKKICRDHSVGYIVNNAGILSPPGYSETVDGLEYTFQINYIAHLLINEIILGTTKDDRHIRIASVTSPVYRFAGFDPVFERGNLNYRAMRSYSSSKLYLAMICGFLSARHDKLNLNCFSFDPGTFSSGIYRTQKKWFRGMYRIAAPFMKNPSGVAKVLAELLLMDDIVNGMVYNTSKRPRPLPSVDISRKAAFMDLSYGLIDKYLT